MSDSISMRFSDLYELSKLLDGMQGKSTVWGSDADQYELVIVNNILSDGSTTRDFKIRPIDYVEPANMPFMGRPNRQNHKAFTAANGVRFTVRILREGDKYGRNECLKWGDNENFLGGWGVEFYDARYPHTKYGQFVSRYYYDTLAKDRCKTGLNLYRYFRFNEFCAGIRDGLGCIGCTCRLAHHS